MLKDVLVKDLEFVFCGTAKGEASARKGYYYASRGNKFYSILHQADFTPVRLDPNQCFSIDKYGIGLTDLVHKKFGNDNQISDESYEVDLLFSKIEEFQPKILAFNRKKSASWVLGYKGVTSLVEYGLQARSIRNTHLFVLPSTSGSARKFWNEKCWFEFRELF